MGIPVKTTLVGTITDYEIVVKRRQPLVDRLRMKPQPQRKPTLLALVMPLTDEMRATVTQHLRTIVHFGAEARNGQKSQQLLVRNLRTTVDQSVDVITKFKAERIDPLLVSKRLRQMEEIAQTDDIFSEEQKRANRRLVFASKLLTSVMVSALLFPPLLLLHIPFLLYLSGSYYVATFRQLVRDRKVTTDVVDSMLSLGSLLYTPFQPSALVIAVTSGWLTTFTQKVMMQTKNGTLKKLTNLFGEQPRTVWIVREDVEIEIPFAQVAIGDQVVIDAGQMIPIDGVIVTGSATIDQHKLTGEAQPAEKSVGDEVFAATVVLTGRIYVDVQKTGVETVAAQVGQILNETSDFTSSVQLRGKAIADRAALPTLVLSGFAWLTLGTSRALAVLFSGLGYNMRLLGPLSVLNYLEQAAHHGILIKDGRALEQVRAIDTVVFDKTGTLTQEQPQVGAIRTFASYTVDQVLTLAAAAEKRQVHPIAKAILHEATQRALPLLVISDAAYEIGYGIQVTIDSQVIRVGSARFMAMEGVVLPPVEAAVEQPVENISQVYVAVAQQLVGIIQLIPTIRPEAHDVVAYLKARGLTTYIISGDREEPTRRLAQELGIDYYFAETLPEHKAELIVALQNEGKTVCFVGDGINDSIALKKANVSVSLRGASTIATDTAQVILMDQNLGQLQRLFALSTQFEANMKVNLATTIAPGMIVIGSAYSGLIGYGGAMLVGMAGLGSGIASAMWPRVTTHRQRDNVA